MSASTTSFPGGTWTLGDSTLTRFGYGAMQLAGPWVMGPPADHDGALAVLREAVEAGITHIDTSAAYGPRVTNELIHDALHPYPDSLLIATKVGANRDAQGGWPTARRPEDLHKQVHENLRSLGVDVLDLVNLRMGDANGPQPGSLTEALGTLVALQQEGLIRHLGVSNVTPNRSPRPEASRRSCACRTCTTSPTVPTTNSSTGSPQRASPTFRSSRSEVSRRCSPRRSRESPPGSGQPRCPWHWPGCSSVPGTSCSSRHIIDSALAREHRRRRAVTLRRRRDRPGHHRRR